MDRLKSGSAVETVDYDSAGGEERRESVGLVPVSVLVVITIATLWLSNQLLPPAAMLRLAEAQTGLAIGSAQLEAIESRQWVGYLFSPLALGVRLLLAALVIQGIGMVVVAELRFGLAFEAAVVGAFATLYGSWVNLLWIWRVGVSNLSLDILGVVPGSVAGFFMSPEASRETLYRLAAEVSLASCLWIVLVALIVRGERRHTWRSALLVGIVAWAVLAAARVGLHAVFVGLVPG